MRENRPYGSEGGGPQLNAVFLPLFYRSWTLIQPQVRRTDTWKIARIKTGVGGPTDLRRQELKGKSFTKHDTRKSPHFSLARAGCSR